VTRYLVAGVAVVFMGLSGVIWAVWGRYTAAQTEIARLGRELATATLIMEQQAESLIVHKAYLKKAEADAAAALATETDVLQQEGADAPLSDYLRSVLDRVR
jgi:HAMP domain-containing protein